MIKHFFNSMPSILHYKLYRITKKKSFKFQGDILIFVILFRFLYLPQISTLTSFYHVLGLQVGMNIFYLSLLM